MKAHSETDYQNDSVDSGSITFKIEGLIIRLNRLQKIGDITIVNTPLDELNYSNALKEYNSVKKKATNTTQFSSTADKAAFLSDLNKCQAVIAFRAGQDASTYLKAWQSANSDDFKTGLQTILEGRIKFLQEDGNITKINESLDSSKYESNKSICDALVKTINSKKSPFSDDIRAKLSFDLNKCQAISAVRAGQDASTYLKACGSIIANRNDFIIELHRIIELDKVANNGQNSELVRKNIGNQLYSPLLKQAFNAVDSYLAANKYVEASNEITSLIYNCNTPKILEKYVEIYRKEANPKKLEECWNLCLSTTKPTAKHTTLAKIFTDLHTAFKSLASADPEAKAKYEGLANKANERAIQHTSQEEIKKKLQEEAQKKLQETNATLTKEEKKAFEQFKKATEEKMKADVVFVTTEAQVTQIQVVNEYKTQLEKENAKLEDEKAKNTAKFKAKEAESIAKLKTATDSKLAAIQRQSPSTKDTLVTPTTPSEESVVAFSNSSNVAETSNSSEEPVVAASDSSNVVAASDSSNQSGLYPSIPALKADISAGEFAAAKASENNVYYNSPFSYTAVESYKTVPTTAVIPTTRNDVPAAEVTTDAEAAKVAEAARVAEAAKVEAAMLAAAETLKKTLLENVKEFLALGGPDNIRDQITAHCKNAIENGINVYDTVDDVRTLVVLASGFLSINNSEKAEEICDKIGVISQDAYKNTYNNKILTLLAKKYSELGLYNSCIESCKKLNQASEENCQLLKTIAEKITYTNKQCAIEIFNVAEYQMKDRKQKAEICLSIGKIYLSLENKAEAGRYLDVAAAYNPSMYKNITIKDLNTLDQSCLSLIGEIDHHM